MTDTSPTAATSTSTKRAVLSWRDVAAGAMAGAFSRTVTAPMERIKLLLQLQHSIPSNSDDHHHNNNNNKNSTTTNTKPRYPSAWHVAQSVYKNEGIWSFWRGNLPSVLRVSGTAAINFTMMNYCKTVVRPILNSELLTPSSSSSSSSISQEQLERRRKNITSLVSGGLAGATSTTLLYPVEFLRTRLAADRHKGQQQQQTYQFHGMRHAFITILRSDGITGLYQGYGVALVGGIFYRILLLGGYDILKSETVRRNEHQYQQQQQLQQQPTTSTTSTASSNTDLSWGQRFVIAQTISLGAGTMSYPLDSVRRRLMMQAGKPHSQRLYRNSIHCFILVAKTEGIRGFYLGIGPNILRSVSGALLLVTYDAFRQGLQ
jgi:solute carrier family 25 (mitochondrial adenine nucleotide translocator), member 4/5/6/31